MELKFIPSIRGKTVKYEILDKLLSENTNFIEYYKKYNEISIYVDLHFLISSILKDDIIKNITTDYFSNNPFEIFEGIINLIGHYRNYFVTRYNLATNIILYHSSDICQYKNEIDNSYYTNYHSKLFTNFDIDKSFIRKNIEYNIRLVKAFIEYVPNAHLVDATGVIDLHTIPNILIEEDTLNLVITNLTSQYSIINTEKTDTLLFTPTFNEKSFIIDKHTFLDNIIKKNKMKISDEDDWSVFKPYMLEYVTMLAGDKKLSDYCGLKRVGLATAIKRVFKLYNNNNYLNSKYIDVNNLIEGLDLDEEQTVNVTVTSKILVNRLFTNEYLTEDITYQITKQMVDKSGLGQLEKINNTKFNNRINLEFILNGEDW